MEARAITVAILAMGGEGGGVLADWVLDMAEHAGYLAQTTSVPGVAQRTGATIYYLEIFPDAGEQPVLALMPVPGEVDVVIASELMEAGRAIQRGLVTPERTTLIASTHRVYSMTERTAASDGRVDSQKLLDGGAAAAKIFVRSDFAKIAQDTNSVISAALFGALASSGALPFDQAQFEDAIRRGGVGVDSSLAAFAAGFQAAREPAPIPGNVRAVPSNTAEHLRALAMRIENEFPPECRAILHSGVERLADYQDESYAGYFLDLLQPLRQVTARCDLLRETARNLALWMSYEDAIRVADLKIRRPRFERVRGEVRANDQQLVRIHEFLHPGVQEIADILPAGLGQWVAGNSRMRRLIDGWAGQGRIVETTSISGFLQLYAIASLRPWRRRSLRFQAEHKKIGEWLDQIIKLASEDYELALEVAACAGLRKGYGDTHRRGSQKFEQVMSAIAGLRGMPDAAERLRGCARRLWQIKARRCETRLCGRRPGLVRSREDAF